MVYVKKASLFLLALLICMGIGVAVGSNDAHAVEKVGAGVYSLDTSANDSYDQADVTKDGKKDKIETVISGEEKVDLKINDATVKSWNNKNQISPSIHVVKLSDKKAYVEITTENFKTSKTFGNLYQVKKGKLQKVLDYEKLVSNKLLSKNDFVYTDGVWDMIRATKASKNTIDLTASLGTKSLGQIKASNLKLKYSNGKLVLLKNAGKASTEIITDEGMSDTFTAAQNIQTVKAAGSSKKGITISKKSNFTITKISIVQKKIYVQAKTKSGKTGWIKLSTSKKPLVKKTGEVIWG